MSRIRGIDLKADIVRLTNRRKVCNTQIGNNDVQSSTPSNSEILQINDLLHKLPMLEKLFDLHRKIGEGTFSTVYLGSLKAHAELPEQDRRQFAVKHLVPTAHPARVEHELRCLKDIGGKDHVIGVDLCLRHLDSIVFIMPYIPHRKFSEYAGSMDAEELRQYMRALLLALQRVHAFGVIHRDIKPSNFLYDRKTRRYMLVDFGLAQRVCSAPPTAASNGGPIAGMKRALDQSHESAPPAKRIAYDQRSGTHVAVNNNNLCLCMGVGGVCSRCMSFVSARAARAGTQGFRPPEVLLKCTRQTTAVDMWAAGVVLTSALLARYPLLRAPDDLTALAEIMTLLGTQPLQRAAVSLGRRLVFSNFRRGLCLRKLCRHLRAPSQPIAPPGTPRCSQCSQPSECCLCRDHSCSDSEVKPESWWGGFPDAAFSLAARLLEPSPIVRISAQEALEHPFITASY